MKMRLLITGFVLLLALSTYVTIGAASESNRAITLTRSVIGSGGMGGSAGSHTIHSTLGQPVAGAVDGGSYHLTSGFWTEIVESLVEFFSFLPLIFR